MSIADALVKDLTGYFGDKIGAPRVACNEVTIDVSRDNMLDVMQSLCSDASMSFETLMDLCGVDYSTYGLAEWQTEQASNSGFSRGVDCSAMTPNTDEPKRFAAVYHLLSIKHNRRLRVRVLIEDNDFPVVDSVEGIWASANWYEREAFDLYGIIFEGHPDLRRLLTDYGFIGHPFRKDFPISGQVEMIYDEEQKRVVYQPVSIEPRVLVPRVVRSDHRFATAETGENEDA